MRPSSSPSRCGPAVGALDRHGKELMPVDDIYDADDLVAESQEVDGEQGDIIGLE